MDGIEATHEILDYEEDEELAHVPIVALTANALKGDRERFLGEGMDEYITKPIETTELLYILNKFLSDKATVNTGTVETPVKKEIPVVEEPEEEINLGLTEDEDALLVDVPTQDDTTTESATPEKKILIAKKFLLARRVLAKVIENLGHDYEILEDFDTLEEALASNNYDILFTDANLVTENLSNTNENIAIISAHENDNPQDVTVKNGESITNTATKEEIENIITKYRG